MKSIPRRSPIDKLDGSEQHHDLKNQPGENGQGDHSHAGGTLPRDVEEAVENSDADTAIAAELKNAVVKD